MSTELTLILQTAGALAGLAWLAAVAGAVLLTIGVSK